jgi:hypothetical protein
MQEFIALVVAVSLPLACLPILWRLEQRSKGAQDANAPQAPATGNAGNLDATLSLVVDQLVARHAGLTQEKRARLEIDLRSAVDAELNKMVLQNADGAATDDPALSAR